MVYLVDKYIIQENMEKLLSNEFFMSIVYAFIFLLIYRILRKTLVKIFINFIDKMTKKTTTTLDDLVFKLIKEPFKFLLNLIVLLIAYGLIDFHLIVDSTDLLDKLAINVFQTGFIIFIAWIFFNATDRENDLFKKLLEAFDLDVNNLLIPFTAKVIRLLVVLMSIALIFSLWGYDVGSFVAGLGISGLAFALAAKDTIANLFGGAVIITEKPFKIGDWIFVDNVEGTVEDITFRSTRIRKFNKSIVTIPNSTVANSHIINYSKRNIRRISYELKVHLDTPIDKLKTVVSEIEEMLIKHEHIDNETIFVKFNKFGDSSLNIFMYFFTNTAVWSDYLSIAEDTNFKILEILQKYEVKLSIPINEVKIDNEC